MASELIAGLGLFKTMLDMAKGLKDMNDAAVRNRAVIELQENILTAKEAQSALLDEVRSLKEQMAKMETWETEKQRYQLTDFGGGTFAYLLKPDMSSGEPPHRICARCYHDGHKSILHFQSRTSDGQDVFTCPRCKAQIFFGVRVPRHDTARTDDDL